VYGAANVPCEAAASDAHPLDVILRAGTVLALVGAVGLLLFGRHRTTKPANRPASA
jgi:hypothetical protein